MVGNLQRNFASGNPSRMFDVGDASFYTPVSVDVTGAAASFDVTGSTTPSHHPNIGTSPIDPSRSMSRYYTLTASGTPSLTSYDATMKGRPRQT